MCLRNPVVTLCMSNRSRCGAVLILISLAQPSRHFVCALGSLRDAVLILAASQRSGRDL